MTLPTPWELAEYSLAAQHPVTRTWGDDETRLAGLAEEHELDVLLATDLDVAAKRAARFAPGRPAEALLNRWVGVGAELSAMLSMRYEGGDPALPFLDATPTSRAPSVADVPALAEAAWGCFADLAPRYLRLWQAAPAGWLPGAGPDKRFVAAPSAALRGRPVDPAVRLVPAAHARPEEVRSAYDAVDAAHPDHRRGAGCRVPLPATSSLSASRAPSA